MSDRKDDEDRVNRNPLVHKAGTIRWDGVRRGPELPSEFEWCDSTRRWWDTWRDSAQAMLMSDTDWEEMLITARLHNLLWGKHIAVDKTGAFAEIECDPKDARSLAGEIRIRLEKMGATIKDRGSLGMKLGTTGADVVSEAVGLTKSVVDYRKNLQS